MNAAFLLLTSALTPGADPAPAVAAPAVAAPVTAIGGGSCGTATVGDCGTCDPCSGRIGLLDKLKAKLCNPCSKGPSCDIGCAPAPAPICHKPIHISIPKPCKVEPVCAPAAPACPTTSACDSGCGGNKIHWRPGMLIHKLKAKLCGNGCDSAPSCEGGCGTAHGGCGSTVIPPTVTPAPMTAPMTTPKTIPPVAPKAGGATSKPISAPFVAPPVAVPAPRTLDLGLTPF